MSSGARESRWPELAALRRALTARESAAVPGRQHPGWRGGDHAAAAGGDGKRAKVMHLLLWGPK
jgi:hypothetical protein